MRVRVCDRERESQGGPERRRAYQLVDELHLIVFSADDGLILLLRRLKNEGVTPHLDVGAAQ